MNLLKNKRVAIGTVVLASVVFLVLFVLAKSFVVNSLDGVNIRNLKIDGDAGTFSIGGQKIYRNGREVSFYLHPAIYVRVAKLGIFYDLTSEDPLFASPEFNAAYFGESLSAYKKTEAEYLKALNLKDSFLPVSFLSSMASVNEKTASFLKNPDEGSAKALTSSYVLVQGNYAEDVSVLKRNIEKAYKNKDQRLYGLDSDTTVRTVLEDLESMAENGQELKKEIGMRQGLYDGNLFVVKFLRQKSGSRFQLSGAQPSGDEGSPILDKAELAVNKDVKDRIDGPYKVETSCFNGGKPKNEYVFGFDLDESNFSQGDTSAFIAKLATNNFYQRLDPKNKLDAAYLKLGLEWRTLKEDNPYRCNNQEYLASLMALQDFVKTYRNDQFFKKFEKTAVFDKLDRSEKEAIREGREKEMAFFAEKIPKDRDFQGLGEVYFEARKALKKYPEAQDFCQDLQERYLLASNRLSGLGKNLYLNRQSIAASIEGLRDGLESVADGRYQYFFRSSYSVFYLNYSRSVWRLNQKPRYLSDDYAPTPAKIIDYEKLQKKYSKTVILSWNRYGLEERLKTVERLKKSVAAEK